MVDGGVFGSNSPMLVDMSDYLIYGLWLVGIQEMSGRELTGD